jgi:2-amino-4-hydroxy-6-hydroxymethyldihydropteridine diphosphokinase
MGHVEGLPLSSPVTHSPQRAFIGLGANQGNARETLAAALDALADLPRTSVVARSSLYSSAPVDARGPDFINAAAELFTTLGADELLTELLRIEAVHGRKRPYRNAPRTLDLDLLLYGDELVRTARLTVPHPRAHLRAFVLRPLSELDPELLIPGVGPIADSLASVADQRIDKLAE